MILGAPIRSFLTFVAGGTIAAAFLGVALVAVLLLVVIPGGLGILTLELERFERGWRYVCAFFAKAKPQSK